MTNTTKNICILQTKTTPTKTMPFIKSHAKSVLDAVKLNNTYIRNTHLIQTKQSCQIRSYRPTMHLTIPQY